MWCVHDASMLQQNSLFGILFMIINVGKPFRGFCSCLNWTLSIYFLGWLLMLVRTRLVFMVRVLEVGFERVYVLIVLWQIKIEC